MQHQNLVLTEKAIKNHCKRLQQEMKRYKQELSLCEVQNLFARVLGFNNFHEVKSVLQTDSHENNSINIDDENQNDFYKFIANNEKYSAKEKLDFFNTKKYFIDSEEDIENIIKKNSYYKDLASSLTDQESKNQNMVLFYLNEDIEKDNLEKFIKKINNITIIKDYKKIIDKIFDAKAVNITKYMLKHASIVNKKETIQEALKAFAFYKNVDMVKYLLEVEKAKVELSTIKWASYLEDNEIVIKYLIAEYKRHHPGVKDFTSLVEDVGVVAVSMASLNNLKLIIALPHNANFSNTINEFKNYDKLSDNYSEKADSLKRETRRKILSYLLNEYKIELSSEIKDFFKKSNYYQGIIN